MKFKKLSNASARIDMNFLRHAPREKKVTNFKRCKSLRASARLMTKIRSHPYLSTRTESHLVKINSQSNEDEDNVRGMSRLRLSNDLEVHLTEGFDNSNKTVKGLKYSGNNEYSILKEEMNQDELGNNALKAYENLAFMDSSFDSTTDSFYHGNELPCSEKKENIEESRQTASNLNNECNSGMTVILKNEPICRIHEWCTRVKMHSAKQFFQNAKKYESGVLSADGREKDDVDLRFSPSLSNMRRPVDGKALKKKKKIQQHRKENVEDRCMDLKVKNISCQIPQGNTIDAKSQSSQAMEFLEGLGRRKALQRNLYQHGKLSSVNANSITIQSSCDIHLHVLFTAIEQGHIDRVKGILESTEIEINSLNADGLSTLDVAVLNNNRQLTKMLITFGAQEGNQFKSPEGLKSHLTMLLAEAERRLQEVGGQVTCPGFSGTPLLEPSSSHSHRGSFSSQHANLAGCGGSAEEKQLASWERRARALKKMLVILEQMGLPDAPVLVTVDVTGTTSVTVKFHESDVAESPLCTKFKLEWSLTEDFSEVCGEEVVLDMKLRQCRVDNLAHGRKYFFRAATGNAKGYSQFKPTTPTYIIPSSWRDVDGRTARFDGRLEQLEQLLRDVRGAEFCLEGPALQRRNHKKKTTIKQLFTASSKFQKNLRRGVFLSCILYHEDRVLVTNEDFLPVIEIDETYPSLIQQDFHWLMKVACSWDDVKCLKQDMEKSQGSSTNHFRIKMLQAASQMQAALCIQDLGQFYHKPIRDVQGTLVLSSVNHVRSSKLVSLLNSKWLPMSKVGKKLSVHEESNVADILMASVQEQVRYHQASGLKLSRGLYLGYLKLQSSVDSIRVVVPAKSPNVLPHCKVRDNPHVSADEWQHLRRLGRREATEQASEQQSAFADALAGAARRLFGYMDMGADEPLSHRIYSAEVVELSAEVSLLVMVPPSESACSPPGSNRELLLKRTDILCLPIQVFEMIHLGTYQRELSSRYFRLSCILELDTARAQHSHREAFSASELSVARERLDRLKDVQARANAAWKAARWLVDLITFARDKTSAGASVRYLASSERQSGSLKRSLLQLPPRDPKLVKASPGRGSWPGPTAGADTTGGTGLGLLGAESLSKSEQQLPLAESAAASRRASGTSQNSTASESGRAASASGSRRGPAAAPGSRLPPSRSEDVLAPGRARHAEHPNASVSAASSPLLGLQPVARSASGATSGSALSVSSDEWPPSRRPAASLAARPEAEGPREEGAPPPGILQVFAAYETGLASGTSLKLHVTPRTTAREVVDLVVRQLNMAVLLKGLEGPVYAPDELVNFCLVAVIGARERCLRDDFKPLQLQNPWKKGRLYVRQKQDVLAALEHSSKHSAYL